MVQKDFMQKIFNIEHVFAPQFSYGKNMYVHSSPSATIVMML